MNSCASPVAAHDRAVIPSAGIDVMLFGQSVFQIRAILEVPEDRSRNLVEKS